MNTKIEEMDGKTVVVLEGEMDTAAAQEAEGILQQFYKNDGKDIIIECEKLEYIASSGLRILIQMFKSAKANGSQLILRHVNDDIMTVFKMTGFINSFTFE